MEGPLVSIVLPTFNRADILPVAIESCLGQTYRNIELIVVNDGSVDDTEKVVMGYVEMDGRVIYHRKENGKLPRALNYGFERSHGEFLTWTSDDNLYLPSGIEEMVRFLEDGKEFGMVYSDFYISDGGPMDYQTKYLEDSPELQHHNTVGACFLYRRSVYRVVGDYDADLELAEDYDYWLRVAKAFYIGHIPSPLYVYFTHKGSLYNKHYYKVKIMSLLAKIKNGIVLPSETINECLELYSTFYPYKRMKQLEIGSLRKELTAIFEKMETGEVPKLHAADMIMDVFRYYSRMGLVDLVRRVFLRLKRYVGVPGA